MRGSIQYTTFYIELPFLSYANCVKVVCSCGRVTCCKLELVSFERWRLMVLSMVWAAVCFGKLLLSDKKTGSSCGPQTSSDKIINFNLTLPCKQLCALHDLKCWKEW